MRKIVIIGATSAIAEQCARQWVQEEPASLLLCGRNAARLERVAADLRVRSPASHLEPRVIDFHDPWAIARAVDSMCAEASPDLVLIAHGTLPEQPQVQQDLGATANALEVNGLSPALFAEAFARHFEQAGKGTLLVIGSVAGDRGRRKNYVYGAGKALLDRYIEGLQHRFAETPVRVVLAKPGPTDTPMTAHLKDGGSRLAPVDQVAREIVEAARRGQAVVYTPAKWRFIMFVIRHLPRFVFNRLDI